MCREFVLEMGGCMGREVGGHVVHVSRAQLSAALAREEAFSNCSKANIFAGCSCISRTRTGEQKQT